MPQLLFLFMLLTIAACGTSRSKYQAYKKGEGYREEQLAEGVKLVRFKGNRHTAKAQAQLFAQFRAVELCLEAGAKLAHILAMNDQSLRRDVTRTSSTFFAPGFYHGMGMYPYWGRYPGFGFSAGLHSMQADSWRETLVYPEMSVFYQCEQQVFEPMLSLREVSPDEMKLLVKDLKGALQVEQVLPGSPNQKALLEGDIILRVEGSRVQSVMELLRALKATPGREVAVEFFRDGVRQRGTMRSTDVTEELIKSQQQIIERACKKKDVKGRPLCQ
jgi:hypothetical protein